MTTKHNHPPSRHCMCRECWPSFSDVPFPEPPTTVRQGTGIYVASRASLPERPALWRSLRDAGWPITSTWIDEAGEGQTEDLGELWTRIVSEVGASSGVLLHVEPGDFPLKGALIEVGMALALGKRVGLYAPGVLLEERSMRPLGSWAAHPLVKRFSSLGGARDWVLAATPNPPTATATPCTECLDSWKTPCSPGKCARRAGTSNEPTPAPSTAPKVSESRPVLYSDEVPA